MTAMTHQPHYVEDRRSPDWIKRSTIIAWCIVGVSSLIGAVIDVSVGAILPVFTLGFGCYLVPWAIAATRGSRLDMVTLLVNVLTGWTIIGWCAALVIALLPHKRTWVQ
jgi:hypothetical protein